MAKAILTGNLLATFRVAIRARSDSTDGLSRFCLAASLRIIGKRGVIVKVSLFVRPMLSDECSVETARC